MGLLENIGRGLLGMLVLLGICYLLSKDRKAINWRTVGVGLALQLVLGLMILKVPYVKDVFDGIASFFVVVLDFTEAGADFVLGDWPDFVAYESQAGGGVVEIGYVFAFKVLPTIIFFSALSSLLYYLGILQWFIKGFAWLMVKTMGLTGAESLAAAANIFIGQTEAPLVVKPYLENMSRSEILCLMTGGMATIAGGVFAAYVGFLGGDDEVARQVFATHLLTASIMSAPAAIVAAKILLPESGEVALDKQQLDIPRQEAGSNFLDAISRGTADGIKLAVNVGAMLLVFTAFVSMFNYICYHWIGSWTGLNEFVVNSTNNRFQGFNIEYILGIVFSPIAWILGVSWEDSSLVGQLLGLKTTLNEFFAYAALEGMQKEMAEKSVIIATYALSGFANFASIGIQIGGISAIAPGQRRNLTELGITSLIGGTIACFLTAIIAGMMYTPTSENLDLGFDSGVSQELSIQRAAHVSNLVYDLSVVIPAEQEQAVTGTMKINFDWDGSDTALPLDFRQDSDFLHAIRLNGDSLPAKVENDHIILPKKNFCRVKIRLT
jgi:CNT family concentrative nucleoside transporter